MPVNLAPPVHTNAETDRTFQPARGVLEGMEVGGDVQTKAASRDADFAAFVAGHAQRLQRLAYAICADTGSAQDLVQEVLISLYLKWDRVEPGDPFAYARRSLINRNASMWRRRRWRLSADGDVGHTSPSESFADEVDSRVALRAAMRSLTARERAVIALRYLEDLSERQTAEALSIAVGTVKSTNARALAKLQTTLGLVDEQV